MNTQTRRIAVPMALIFVSMVVSAIVAVAVYMSPHLEDFALPDAKIWFAGPFIQFTYTMVALYLVATGATLLAFVLHYRSDPPLGVRWLVELRTNYVLIIAFSFFFDDGFWVALDRGVLSDIVTAHIIENRDLLEAGRRVAFIVSLLIIALIYLRVRILRRRSPEDSF